MLSKRMWSIVWEWKALASRIVWTHLKCSSEELVIVSAYGPGNEEIEGKREEFWETLSECVNGFEQIERIIVLGDMNAQVGDLELEEVIGEFGVPGVNWAGRRMVRFCTEAGLIAGSTWFKKKQVNKHTSE
jgi:hypothetical protein